ncbi:peptide ABC transporter substrate-binding protein [Candidatus Nomurabacteria bacterium]|nr:peptide ABC transporter substrate-binding protein [Candidatus Nomurabacteria bacterium]
MRSSQQPKRPSWFDRFFSYLRALKTSDRFVLYAAGLVFIIAALCSVHALSKDNLVTIPERGGILKEGVLGAPRFVNPVLAITRADMDLSSLIYSGLLKLSAEGTLENDLAESITVSDDGLIYNVVLKENISFHDGVPVTADDVLFTIALIQNPDLKSPLRGSWSGVSTEKISEREFNIILETPYTPFMENLTVGILPKHLWGGLSIEELPFSQTNTEPVGSGAYELETLKRTKSGLIESYVLRAYSQHGQTPNIDQIEVTFFSSESDLNTALTSGAITSTAYLDPKDVAVLDTERFSVYDMALPRVFTIFFNQNKTPVLRDSAVREALDTAIDKEALVTTVLGGHGIPTDVPVPAGFSTLESTSTKTTATGTDDRIAKARAILEDGDWVQSEDGVWQKDIDDTVTTLSLTLATGNTDVFVDTAAFIADAWETLGVAVEVQKYEQTDLVQAVIRPRDYQTLLFGTDIGRSLDLYPFWHSSQREDPGLNIAAYANITADDQLEVLRSSTDENERRNALQAFNEEIEEDHPAIFLYTPTFTFVVNKNIMSIPLQRIARASERFSTIADWYMNEDQVWPFFTDN